MPVSRRNRVVAAEPERVWEVIEDPHHMPRWWPGVRRMEAVADDRWTQVFITKRGRPVRADFRLLDSEPGRRRSWEQEIPGTPFERVLSESVTEVTLEPADGGGTQVTISQQQKLRGSARTGGFLLRRATRQKLDEALDGLEQLFG